MSGPRRVARIITRLNIGGPARQALSLSKDLAPDYETTLIAGRSQQGEGELSDPEVPVKRVSLVRPVSPLDDLRAARCLRQLISAGRFELVHTHMAKAGSLGRRAAWKVPRSPVTVHTFHGHVLEGYFYRPVQKAFIATERSLAKRTDALVAVSEHVRDDLLGLGIGTPERWRVIPLGFDLAPMLAVSGRSGRLREALALREDVPLVGVLGRLAPIKDHQTLLQAIARLEDAHLAILGDGHLRPALQERAERLGISKRVHFVGWWLDVADAISDLDVVALTSRNEGTPVSLIEASACGLPVVSTDVGGVRAVVRDGSTGLLVSPGDVEGVAMALERILSDPTHARSLGDAGRDWVRERFSKDRLVSDIRQLYSELLSS